jgi:hypothetical protein
MPLLSGSFPHITGTLSTTEVGIIITILVVFIFIISFYIFYKSVLTNPILDPNMDHTLDDEWRSAEDKKKHEEDVNEFLEYVTEDVEKEENSDF